MEWNEETARTMKAHGLGFYEISRTLGVSYYMVRPEPVESEEIDAGPFTTASGIKAYTEPETRVMQRGMGHRMIETRVSLPFVSIQFGRTALESKEGRG